MLANPRQARKIFHPGQCITDMVKPKIHILLKPPGMRRRTPWWFQKTHGMYYRQQPLTKMPAGKPGRHQNQHKQKQLSK